MAENILISNYLAKSTGYLFCLYLYQCNFFFKNLNIKHPKHPNKMAGVLGCETLKFISIYA